MSKRQKAQSTSERKGTKQPFRPGPSGSGSKFLVLLLINILVAMFWAVLVPVFGTLDYVIGYLVGLAFLTLVERSFARQTVRVLSFLVYAFWQIVLSSVSVAWIVVQPRTAMHAKLKRAIVSVPLTVSSDFEIAALATLITLTPGTLSMELSNDRSTLYVHSINVNDIDAFRREIKDGFEYRILQITQGIV
ncbi:cation transporter [bacterium]|nr:cation transporter [bacterium]